MYKSLDNIIRKTESEEEWLSKLKKIKDYNALDSDGNSPLTISAYYGYLEGCKYIIHNGGHVDYTNKYSETPLKCAIGSLSFDSGHIQIKEVIYFLIEHNADINKADENKVSCLMEALNVNCSDIAITLIKKGADVNFRNKWRMTPLMYAGGIDINIYQELIEAGADVNAVDEFGRNPLYYAAKRVLTGFRNYTELVISLLLKQGSNLETGDAQRGDTLLHVAASNGLINLISVLLNSGHKLNVQDNEGDTPLIKACKKKELGAVKQLLENGADLSLENKKGENAMTHAVETIVYTGDNEVKEILVEYGATIPKLLGDANVEEVNEKGDTALIVASKIGPLEKLRELINRGVNINHQNKHGKTALMLACSDGTEEKVEMLLKNGADTNIQDNYGKTALIYLMDDNYYGDSDRKKFDLLLETSDINANLQTKTGMTALMYACKVTWVDHYYIERLIEKGARVNIETNKGKTACSFIKYDPPLKELLLKYNRK